MIVGNFPISSMSIAAGAQRFVLPSNFHGGVPSRKASKTKFFATSSVSLCSRNDFRQLVSIKSISSLHSAVYPANRNLECRSVIEKAGCSGSFDVEVDKSKAEIRRKNLAVFVSGGGSNFRAIYEAILNGSVHGDIAVLVTNKQDCGGAAYARGKGIPVIVFPGRNDSQEAYSAEDLVTSLSWLSQAYSC